MQELNNLPGPRQANAYVKDQERKALASMRGLQPGSVPPQKACTAQLHPPRMQSTSAPTQH